MSVSLDLDALRPPNKTFRSRGVVYEIPAELAVETIVEALQLRGLFQDAERSQSDAEARQAELALERARLERELHDAPPDRVPDATAALEAADRALTTAADEAGGAEASMIRAMEAMRGIVWTLIDEARPPAPAGEEPAYPRLSIEEITAVLTLAMGGNAAAGDTPESVARDVVQGEPADAEAEGRPEGDPPASTSASPAAPTPATA